MERMRELIAALDAANDAYYNRDTEIMSNREYDGLYDELAALESETGVILPGSPTQRVGAAVVDGLRKVRHKTPMLSLNKTKEAGELRDFLGEQAGVLSWKMDGLTIVLTYEGGGLLRAVTRGNGEIGEDVTHNARRFKNLPLRIEFEGELIIRGEAIISYSDFQRLNDALPDGEKYKNPRNLTSGAVRQLDSGESGKRGVKLFAFALVGAQGRDFSSRLEQLEFLRALGFETVEHEAATADDVVEKVRRFAEKIETNDFPSDGLVLCYDDIAYGEGLGVTSKFPRDAIAYKWADETAETTLLSVEWATSRTGLVNPVAIFESVELEGTTVNRASLQNLSVIEGLELGLGDRIAVYKANMIIPQVAENLTRSGGLPIPSECPSCGRPTVVTETKEGRFLSCANEDCGERRVQALAHFVSRDAMNIEGLSEQTLAKFINCGFIKDYPDIYALPEHDAEIRELEGFGARSAARLAEAIEKSKDTRLHNFIYALGINQVGLSGAKLLCKRFGGDFERIVEARTEELLEIAGFGEVISNEISKYFGNERNLRLAREVLLMLKLVREEETAAALPLAGLSFAVTGEVLRFASRKELQEKVELNGGKVTSSVTSRTNYLINNDAGSASSKNKKAKELGVKIITEDEFLEMVK